MLRTSSLLIKSDDGVGREEEGEREERCSGLTDLKEDLDGYPWEKPTADDFFKQTECDICGVQGRFSNV